MGAASHQDELRNKSILARLREELQGTLPGLAAQLRMISHPRPGHQVYQQVRDSCVTAGVLVLIYPREGRLTLVLTRRTENLDQHQAQISFPGGRQETGETFAQTALREAGEELGVRPADLQILGYLTPLYIPPSNFCIYPVVASADERPEFHPSEEEVAEVIEVPLDHLVLPKTIRREVWALPDKDYEVPFYFYEGHKIWGATAMVLAELVTILEKLEL